MSLSAIQSTAAQLALAGTVALAAFGASAQTAGLEPGQCYDPKAATTALTNDGQKYIFAGKRNTDGGPLNGVTMNDNGYGYVVEKDDVKKKLCFRATFKEVQLNYIDNPQIPSWAQHIQKNGTIDVQKMYRGQDEDTARLVFYAQTYTKDALGNEVNGKKMAIAVAPAPKLGNIWAVNSKGIPETTTELYDFGIVAQNFNYFMGRGHGSVASGGTDKTAAAYNANAPKQP